MDTTTGLAGWADDDGVGKPAGGLIIIIIIIFSLA